MGMQIDGIEIFAATKARERETLGERATEWLHAHPDLEVVDHEVTQSSDNAFHCLTITLFYRRRPPEPRA